MPRAALGASKPSTQEPRHSCIISNCVGSSEDWFGFEGVIESEEEFPHDCCESEFVRFAFGTQTLVKTRQDRIEASGRKCSHVKSAAQSAASTEDGATASLQCRAAALARSFLAQSARKSFISALSPRMRGATPLYFFVVPVIVRLTAP